MSKWLMGQRRGRMGGDVFPGGWCTLILEREGGGRRQICNGTAHPVPVMCTSIVAYTMGKHEFEDSRVHFAML